MEDRSACVEPRTPRAHWWRGWIVMGGALMSSTAVGVAWGHERFVRHNLLHPINYDFFSYRDPNMLSISLRVYVAMAAMLVAWFSRDRVHALVRDRLRLVGAAKGWTTLLFSFVTDRPVEHAGFDKIGQWAVILFLRCPALVLMYSAANDALVMPSFPLAPASAPLFKYLQVALALAIITQAFLPAIGIALFGLFGYQLYAYGFKVAVDVLPVLTVAAVYVTLPWRSHLALITKLSREQIRIVRVVLGLSFLALGWMKVYNHDLIIGVADNYPWVMQDPLIRLFYAGTDPQCTRECWSVAFAGCEVLTGSLLMLGAFSRLWAAQMVFVFGKLMLVDFGWAEIPHLYPIGAFLLLAFSNNLCLVSEVEPRWVRRVRPREARLQPVMAYVMAGVLAFFAVAPMSYLLAIAAHR